MVFIHQQFILQQFIHPVWHEETLPVAEAPQEFTLDSDDEQSVNSTSSDGLSM